MKLRGCIRKNFLTFDEWNSFNWDRFYKNAKFKTEINFI